MYICMCGRVNVRVRLRVFVCVCMRVVLELNKNGAEIHKSGGGAEI